MNKSCILSSGLMVLFGLSAQILAGNIEPPAGPNDPASAMYTIEAVYQRLLAGADGAKRTGAFTGPPGPPGSTMHDMNEVMAVAPSNVVNAATTNEVLSGQIFWGLTTNEWGTLSGTMPDIGAVNYTPGTADQAVAQGYHNGSGIVQGDPDLVATNIRVAITVFGVTGTIYECSVPKTGQTISDLPGDDGDLEKGVAWPVPRFTNHGNGTVTDNMTGLMWKKNANLCGAVDWTNAIVNCNNLTYAEYSDWRLPNMKELYSLVDLGQGTGLPSGHPFSSVQPYIWSSTTCASDNSRALYLRISEPGGIRNDPKTASGGEWVWPVRGGQ